MKPCPKMPLERCYQNLLELLKSGLCGLSYGRLTPTYQPSLKRDQHVVFEMILRFKAMFPDVGMIMFASFKGGLNQGSSDGTTSCNGCRGKGVRGLRFEMVVVDRFYSRVPHNGFETLCDLFPIPFWFRWGLVLRWSGVPVVAIILDGPDTVNQNGGTNGNKIWTLRL